MCCCDQLTSLPHKMLRECETIGHSRGGERSTVSLDTKDFDYPAGATAFRPVLAMPAAA